MAEIKVDFNNSEGDGFIFARASRASAPLAKGDWVRAMDFEGNECRAQVIRVEDGLVYLAPDFETWISGEDSDSSTQAQVTVITYSHASKRRLRVRRRRSSHGTGASGQLVGVA
jgi:hypothetical protein